MKHVYEVCDTTDDEHYYPLGMFASKSDAREAIRSWGDTALNDASDEFEHISIIKRAIGWSSNGKVVEIYHREQYLDYQVDEWKKNKAR